MAHDDENDDEDVGEEDVPGEKFDPKNPNTRGENDQTTSDDGRKNSIDDDSEKNRSNKSKKLRKKLVQNCLNV